MERLIAPGPLVTVAVMCVAMVVGGAVPAQADIVVFTAVLQAANEIAPVVVHPTETGVSGSALITLDVTRAGTVITAATARFDVSLTGFPSSGTSLIILSHIHQGGPTVNGPIVVDSGIGPGSPVATPGGSATYSRANLTTSPAVAQAIIDAPGGFYFNVHTALSPSGVARGQLAPQQTAVPTLSQWGMILVTLLFISTGMFFLRRRRVAV